MAPNQRTSADNAQIAIEDYDLACARLAWATARDQRGTEAQLDALEWHRQECAAAQAELDAWLSDTTADSRPA